MNKISHLSIAVALALSCSANAAPSVSTELGLGIGFVKNGDGGMGLASNGGIDSAETRSNADLDLTSVLSFANADVQLGLSTSRFQKKGSDEDDTTKYTADVSAHYLHKMGEYRIGAFVGAGRHNDNGDSDQGMRYRFYGVEFDRQIAKGSVFGQLGYFDSYDEYNEGTQDSTFIRVGGTYALDPVWTATGSLAYAKGDKYSSNYDNSIWALELGIERVFTPTITGFASYELDRIGYDDGNKYGDVFHTAMVGVKIAFGTSQKNTKAMSLPSFGRWVAFNANEIE